jgi:predicted AAA+ superfamily ATPase
MKSKIIFRKGYFDLIEPFIGDRLIKVLTGQRRVGKSYVLYQVMEEIRRRNADASIIYIDKEDYAFDGLKNYVDLMEYIDSVKNKKSKNYLFIDEVQEIQDFEKALRSLQNSEEFDIYCTGSNATLLSGELASMLSGRYVQIRIFSLSYPEFLQFHQMNDSSESLLKYMKHGGMPHLINLRSDDRVYVEYHRNVLSSIVLRDVVSRYKVRNVNFLQDLIRFLADNVGSIVSAKRISDFLKSQNINLLPKTILEYLYFLEMVFFVNRVKRIEVEGRKNFEIGDKFYFEDIGMRNAIIPYQQKDIHKILENLVYHHLKTLQYDVFVGKDGNKEIDFVAERQGKRIYIQVSYLIIDDKTHEREFGNLLSINDNCRKLVVSMDEFPGADFKGIEQWNIREFLMRFE